NLLRSCQAVLSRRSAEREGGSSHSFPQVRDSGSLPRHSLRSFAHASDGGLTSQSAICILRIAMTLGEKVRSLRSVEGDLRGLGREMSQQEVADAIRQQLAEASSQSYLSQIESGTRPHLTHHTRLLLSRFFKVHPGYLVTDPPGY